MFCRNSLGMDTVRVSVDRSDSVRNLCVQVRGETITLDKITDCENSKN